MQEPLSNTTKTVVIDLDGTLTHIDAAIDYSEVEPRLEVIAKLREYAAAGYRISIYTSRNMKTFRNAVGRINAVTLPIIIEWLKKHDVPFDEVHVGKPWCGQGGFYVDDKAIRPSEFERLSQEQIRSLLDGEKLK